MSIQKWVASVLLLMIIGGSLHAAAHGGVSVPYPKFYRLMPLVKGRFIGPNNPNFPTLGGLDYVYANLAALASYDNRPFNEGSMLVNERVHTSENANGVFKEDAITFVAVMIKDSRRFAQTGGWGFNMFTGDKIGLTLEQAKTQCFDACHASQAARDFVFSDYRKL